MSDQQPDPQETIRRQAHPSSGRCKCGWRSLAQRLVTHMTRWGADEDGIPDYAYDDCMVATVLSEGPAPSSVENRALTALAGLFPVTMPDGSRPAMDPANPEAMAAVIRENHVAVLRVERERGAQLVLNALLGLCGPGTNHQALDHVFARLQDKYGAPATMAGSIVSAALREEDD